jgi:hypothetical protein
MNALKLGTRTINQYLLHHRLDPSSMQHIALTTTGKALTEVALVFFTENGHYKEGAGAGKFRPGFAAVLVSAGEPGMMKDRVYGIPQNKSITGHYYMRHVIGSRHAYHVTHITSRGRRCHLRLRLTMPSSAQSHSESISGL